MPRRAATIPRVFASLVSASGVTKPAMLNVSRAVARVALAAALAPAAEARTQARLPRTAFSVPERHQLRASVVRLVFSSRIGGSPIVHDRSLLLVRSLRGQNGILNPQQARWITFRARASY